MEAGAFQLVARTIHCDPPCELCAAISEQVKQLLMLAELELPKRKRGQPPPPKKKFSLPLAHPLCDKLPTLARQHDKNFKVHTPEKAAFASALCIRLQHLTGKQNHLHNAFA